MYYYNNTLKGFAYDSRNYRTTQYDIWPIEDSLQHKRIYYVINYKQPGITTDSIKVSAGTWYGGWVDDARTYQKVKIDNGDYVMSVPAGQKKVFDLTITNPYPFAIDFSDKGYLHKVYLEACFFDEKGVMTPQMADTLFNKIALKPGQSAHYSFPIVSPKQKGRYELLFSLRTDPFPGSKNSRIVKFTTE